MRISYIIAAMGLITVLTMDLFQIQCWRPPAHKAKPAAATTAPAIPAANPNNAKSLNRRAISLHSQGKYSEPLADYRRALKLDRKNPAYHNNIALLFKDMDLLAEAEKESQRAIALNPKRADYYYNQALILQKRQKLYRAKAKLARAVKLDPEDPQFRLELGHVNQLISQRQRSTY